MNKQQRMYENIKKHGDSLKTIFRIEGDSIKLCKKLHRLERKAHQLATDYCNGRDYAGDEITCEVWFTKSNRILKKVNEVLNNINIPIFINGDARGYALKIDDGYIRENAVSIHKDWGGYGILSPDFS